MFLCNEEMSDNSFLNVISSGVEFEYIRFISVSRFLSDIFLIMLLNGVIPIPPAMNICGPVFLSSRIKVPFGPSPSIKVPVGNSSSVFLNPDCSLIFVVSLKSFPSVGDDERVKCLVDPRGSGYFNSGKVK